MKHGFIFLIISTIGLLLACGSETEDFGDGKFGYDYFPLELGKFWIYQVDSTIYDDEGATIINTTAQVKEEIVEQYTDEIGDEIFRIERFWRRNSSDLWQIRDVWTSFTSEAQAYKTEENLKFIKFIFPPSAGKRWDGNIFFDENVTLTVAGENLKVFKGWDEYRMESVDLPEVVGDVSYDNVATVLLTDDESLNSIERRYALEKYARGVGLIYKEFEILDSQCSSCSASWLEKAEKGFILKQTLLEHN